MPVRLREVEAYLRRVHGGPRELGVDELDVLDRHAEAVVLAIEDQWPVDTSTSRDAFTYTVQGHAGEVGYTIENDVDYAQYVHRAGESPDSPLWRTLIPDEVRADAPGLNADMRRAIDQTERALAFHAAARAAAARGTKRQHLTANQVLARSWVGWRAAA